MRENERVEVAIHAKLLEVADFQLCVLNCTASSQI